jgi:hypothetical protein
LFDGKPVDGIYQASCQNEYEYNAIPLLEDTNWFKKIK